MKTTKIIIALICCLFMILSCSNRKPVSTVTSDQVLPVENKEKNKSTALVPGTIALTDNDFGDLIELKGTPITTEVMFKPQELEFLIKNDMMIIKTFETPGLIKFLSLPDLKLIRQVGTKGQGPGELLFPTLVGSSEPGILCYLFDLQQQKLYSINNDFVMNETGFLFQKEDNLFGSRQIIETGSRQFHYASNSTTGKGIYKYSVDHPDSLKLVYDLEDGFKKNLGWSALIGDFAGNREKNRLAYAYKYFHQIRFFDLLTGSTRTVRFDAANNQDAGSPDPKAVLAPTSVTHYWGVSATPDHLFCIYSGRTPIEVQGEFKDGTDHIFIEQYDWNGNPVKRYRLDHWGYFCVDEARRSIYVAAVNADEPMYVYKF